MEGLNEVSICRVVEATSETLKQTDNPTPFIFGLQPCHSETRLVYIYIYKKDFKGNYL